MKTHGLLERDGNRYADRFTESGGTIAGLVALLQKYLCELLDQGLPLRRRHAEPQTSNSNPLSNPDY
jgi:hypothetical protein